MGEGSLRHEAVLLDRIGQDVEVAEKWCDVRNVVKRAVLPHIGTLFFN